MRRLAARLAPLLVAVALASATGLASATPAGAVPTVAPSVVVQDDDDGRPSIIPDPDEEGTSNFVGLAVVAVLFAIWFGGGAVLLVRARRRSSGDVAGETAERP